MTEDPPPPAAEVVIVRDHYGCGVTTYRSDEPDAVHAQPSFDAAVAFWQVTCGLGPGRVVDDQFGRYVVRFGD